MNQHIVLINQVINYIELNLQSRLTVEAVAKSVNYSRFHVVRLFRRMTGETISSYIRKRRLHEAARELLVTKKTIVDIALDYQFQSQEAFTRSFKSAYRYPPSTYRKRGRNRQYFPRLTLRFPKLLLLPSQRIGVLPARPLLVINYHSLYDLTQRKPNHFHLYFC